MPGPGLTVGLTSEEAGRLQAVHGPNALPTAPRPSILLRVAHQLTDPMILLLLGASVITATLGDTIDTVVILVVVVLNSALGVVQEVRAEHALAALADLTAPVARVVRDGMVTTLPADELVPGDVVHLEGGDIVPADVLVDEAYDLQLDESVVTGESLAVERDRDDTLMSGTVVTRGRAVATVSRIGQDSAIGRIAGLVSGVAPRPTPLQRRLSRLSRELVLVAAVACFVVFLLGIAQGRGLAEMLVVAVSLAVAAVPESLPAVVSVALALGAHRMAKRSAIVRALPAVETLGSVSVIASDKTGTLTEGRMTASRSWTPAGGLHTGPAVPSREVSEPAPDLHPSAERLLRDCVLCNDAHLTPPTSTADVVTEHETTTPTEPDGLGDPLEVALLRYAVQHGVDPAEVRAEWPRVGEVPFDAQTRRMTTQHASRRGERLTVVKGAPESVFALVDADDAGVAGTAVEEARRVADRLASEGFRVIAVAERRGDTSATPPAPGAGDAPRVRLVGLVAVSDPPRGTARDVIETCRDAGVGVVMVTGDHAETAYAIASELGITDRAAGVMRGDEISRETLDARVLDTGVYARTRPEQKVDIVEALQRAGHVVAVTGDGVNDAPALRAADIGVAMGRGGTEVARQAADLVLGDDDLRTVLVAIEEGRRILANIRAFLRYALSGGLAEVLVMVFAPLMGMPVPLLPAQILWINMLTHGLPGVAFGAEPVDPALMSRPSAHPDESVLGQGLWKGIAWVGALIAVVSLVGGGWAQLHDQSVQAHVFAVLGFAQLGVALALRSPRRPGSPRVSGLTWAVLGSMSLQLLALYLPALQDVLRTSALNATSLAFTLALAAVPGLCIRLVRHLKGRDSTRRDLRGT